MFSPTLTVAVFLAAASCGISDAATHHTSVACPGQNLHLVCPEGSLINLLALAHGEASPEDCAAVTHLDELEDHCIEPLLYPWAKTICNKMERCRLPEPDQRMFKCGFSENSFIVAKYACFKPTFELRSLEVCGGEAKLKCESGTITIMKANYGRVDRNACTTTMSDVTYCSSPSANVRVQEMCNTKTECTIPINKDELGQPLDCDDLPVYLHVNYVCG